MLTHYKRRSYKITERIYIIHIFRYGYLIIRNSFTDIDFPELLNYICHINILM
jgi:hypothetical protein